MRKFVFIFLFVVASLSYIFEIDELLVKKFTFFNDLKISYINKVINISTNIEKHFNQAKTIEDLRAENNELKEYKILYNTTQKQLDAIKEFLVHVEVTEIKPEIELVKVLSYINFNDFTKVWLDKVPQDDKILGLITENNAAGIVVNKNGRAVGLLNGNKDCSYAVFIGEGKNPGIITAGETPDELLIKFIPIWSEINKGDEVITSGMDNIFYEGLKVGRIIEITNLPDMKIATVKPYVNVLKKKYFYTYKNINNLENKEENSKKTNEIEKSPNN
ncbi:MAG: rod shape-determining protein MreC [Arcobacter sp.]|jgi:rod shape-determining protein MreC|uniref:Rod shape-determining protein MreC n=1 Tax=Arcobacter defluvii TaxID=873191 RepID=A0AAE7BGG4_9BACT|nr:MULTISPECIES: rod shape-determining protein MreC [Arcobacter]MDY3200384.1 rod shape-determining protein MreC [Arcobacter sp.]QKF78851.1 rod shape-determining protein MreC [Arcobacter defluvii]RXI30434.1 rod shape-determining protein MreC [Arcobacter defluvii]BAK74608.1 rod shape-determining protein MreC [Arcobacter sp. L]